MPRLADYFPADGPTAPQEQRSCGLIDESSVVVNDDDGGPDTGSYGAAIEVTPESFVIPQGGSIDLTITIARVDGDVEPVAITVDGLPPGVTSTEITLDGKDTSGVVTLTAPSSVGIPDYDAARIRARTSAGSSSALIRLAVRGPASELDTSFGNGGVVRVLREIHDVVEQSDGKLVFTGSGDTHVPTVCRLMRNGAPDVSFGETDGCSTIDVGSEAVGTRVAISGESVLVAGHFVSEPGMLVARLTPAGTLDPSFGAGGWTVISSEERLTPTAMLVGGDSILLAGVSGYWTTAKAFLLRLTSDGALDSTFANGGLTLFADVGAKDLVWLGDCRFAVTANVGIFVFGPDGDRELTFGEDGYVRLPLGSIARDSSGSLIAGGTGASMGLVSPGGTVEAVYGPLEGVPGVWATAHAHDIGLHLEGTMVFAGEVNHGDDTTAGLGRRLSDGNPDPDFSVGGARAYSIADTASDLEILRDQRYVVAGTDNSNAGILFRVWN